MASLIYNKSAIIKHSGRRAPLKFNKFSRFNELPIEIRLEIWRQTIQPQNVAIGLDREVRRWEFQYHFNRIFPVALHVCRESCNELLRQYTCISLTPTRLYQNISPPRRYVNFAIDTFIFPDLRYGLEHFFEAMGRQSQMIQSIVVGTDTYGDIGERTTKLLSQLPHLNSLRINLGGVGVYKELLVFDPTVEHELLMDGAPDSFSWSFLLEAFRSRIAKHWPRELLPLKGFNSMDNGCEPRCINEKCFATGSFRYWMKPE